MAGIQQPTSQLGNFQLGNAQLPGELPIAGLSHHITLQKGSARYGFMLIPGSNPLEQPLSTSAPIVANTQDPIYSHGTWRAWVQENWIGGEGQEDWVEPDRFVKSWKVHSWRDGQLMLVSRWSRGIDISSSNNYLDFSEAGYTKSCWVASGSYAPGALATALQTKMNAAAVSNTYTVSFSATTGKFTIARATGSSTISLLWKTGPNTSKTIGAAMGYAVSADDTGGTSYAADYIATSPLDASVIAFKFVDYGDDSYALCQDSQGVRRYDVVRRGWYESLAGADSPDDCTDGCVFGDNLFVLFGNGATTQFYNGSDWADVEPVWSGDFCIPYKDKFYYSKANVLYATDTPATAVGTAITDKFGDTSTEISSLCVYGDDLYVGKPDGLWRTDGENVAQVLDRRSESYVNNFRNMVEYQGSLFFAVMQRIYKYTGSGSSATIVDITPKMPKSEGASAQLYGYGLPMAFSVAGPCLFVGFDNGGENGTRPYVLAYNGRGWHNAFMRVLVETLNDMYAVDYSPNADMLWVNTGRTRGQQFLSISDMPYPDYEETGDLFLCVHRGGFPQEPKAWHKLWFETRDCDNDNYIQVHMEKNEGKNEDQWTLVGEVKTSPYVELYFDSPTTSINRKQMRLRLRFRRGTDTSKTPILQRMGVMFQDRHRPLHAYILQVMVGPGVELLGEFGSEWIAQEELIDFLKLCEGNVEGLTYTDRYGYSHPVLMQSLIRSKESELRADREIDCQFQISLVEIA